MKDHPGSLTIFVPAGKAIASGLEISCSPRGVNQVRFVRTSRATPCASPTARAFAARHGWLAPAMKALVRYLDGQPCDLRGIPVDLSGQPPFRRRVQETCRGIAYGRTLTYAELAERVGVPGAARAVGSAMSHNPVPLLVPCHRVIRGDGGLGGFSARGGVALKARLLAMERRDAKLGG
jgi:methylated-DNA-[protein]-cysteine S-methyltransferase